MWSLWRRHYMELSDYYNVPVVFWKRLWYHMNFYVNGSERRFRCGEGREDWLDWRKWDSDHANHIQSHFYLSNSKALHTTKKIIRWRFQSSESCPLPELNIETYVSGSPAGIIFRVVLENQARIFPEILYPCHKMHDAVPRIPQYPSTPLLKPRNWPIRRSTSLTIHSVYVS
jgi:hypothetical protein